MAVQDGGWDVESSGPGTSIPRWSGRWRVGLRGGCAVVASVILVARLDKEISKSYILLGV